MINKYTVGLAGVLTLIFLTLKLAQAGLVVSWSWWWVFSPFPVLVAATVALVVLIALVLLPVRFVQEYRKLKK